MKKQYNLIKAGGGAMTIDETNLLTEDFLEVMLDDLPEPNGFVQFLVDKNLHGNLLRIVKQRHPQSFMHKIVHALIKIEKVNSATTNEWYEKYIRHHINYYVLDYVVRLFEKNELKEETVTTLDDCQAISTCKWYRVLVKREPPTIDVPVPRLPTTAPVALGIS